MNLPGSTQATRTVRCPCCSGPAVYDDRNRWRPFCSEACRQHDFGAWASDSYRVAAETPPDGELPGESSGAAQAG